MAEQNQVTNTKSSGANERPVLPAVDIFEDAGGITLLADMPGVTKERLEVKLDGDGLSIEGRVELDAPAEMRAIWAEVSVPRFHRTFTLSRELDADRIEANRQGRRADPAGAEAGSRPASASPSECRLSDVAWTTRGHACRLSSPEKGMNMECHRVHIPDGVRVSGVIAAGSATAVLPGEYLVHLLESKSSLTKSVVRFVGADAACRDVHVPLEVAKRYLAVSANDGFGLEGLDAA